MTEKKDLLQKMWLVCPLVVICCGLWGSALPAIKIGYRIFDIGADSTAGQIVFAGARFFLAGIIVLLIGSLSERKVLVPQKGSWNKIIVLCIFQSGLQCLLCYIGLAHTSGVKASIIEGVNVFVAIIVASVMFHQEELTGRKIAGCIVGFMGVVLVNLAGTGGINLSFSLKGEGFIFLSTVADAFSSVYLKKISESEKPVILLGYQFIIGGALVTACGYFLGGRIRIDSLAGAGVIIYLALVSAVAYFIWGFMVKHNPISKVMIFIFMTPVFGVIFSALILREGGALNVTNMTALILVCIGIYVVNGQNRVYGG